MMKTEMTISTLQRLRVAGLLLLLSLTIPTLNWAFILSGFTSAEGHLAEMITSREPLFRLNILIQVFCSILTLSLGCVLHRILNDTSPTLSIFALLLRAIESGAILVLVVLQSVGLLILKAGEAMVVSGMVFFAFVVVYDTLMITCLNS